MIIDTSALIAIAKNEPDAEQLRSALVTADALRISAGTLLETYIVMDGKRNPTATALLDALLERIAPVIEPVTAAHVSIARDAYRQYGKGSGHGARLNYGDCFAYALARERNESLLYTGNDFGQTDIEPAVTRNR